MRVALLEAGKKITPKDFTEHMPSWQLPYLGLSPKIREERPIQSQCYACREYNYDWFVNDRGESVHAGEAVQLDSPARAGRAIDELGPAKLSHERSGFQSREPRRLWRRLADLLRRDGPVLRRGRAVRRHQRNGRGPRAIAGQRLPSRHGDDVRRGNSAQRGEAEDGPRGDHRPRGHPYQAAQRPRRVPLLRAVRAGLQHVLVLQQPVDHHRRRAEDRAADADRPMPWRATS